MRDEQPKTRIHTDEEYLLFDPFAGDDVTIECHRVKIVVTRSEHLCVAPVDRKNLHSIPIGTRAYKETAKVEGRFGSSFCCLPCLDKLMAYSENN